MIKNHLRKWRRNEERGQTMIVAVLVIGTFLLGFLGLAVDFSGLWFKKQIAQSAADAACQAGAMNMLLIAQGVGTTTAGFTPGTPATWSCATGSWPDPAHQPTPCWYANANGYSGAGLLADAESNAVEVSFPTVIPGVSTPPSSLAGSYPFMQVTVTDRSRVFFSSLFTGRRTADVKAAARCGLVLTSEPIPIIVLHPTMNRAFNVSGNSTVRIFGGPSQSIQVNSSDAQAAYIGGSNVVDLSQGGPGFTGSDLGTWGGPATQPGPTSFIDPTGSTVDWLYRHFPISDPFATVPAPSNAGMPTRPQGGTDLSVNYDPSLIDNTHDPLCPVAAPNTCVRFYPGYYPNGIQVKQMNALFVPGVYYLDGDMDLLTQSSARPSAMTGDGTSGTMFYFHGTTRLNVSAQTGLGYPNGVTLTPFPVALVQCPAPSGAPPDPPLTGPLNGNIFLGPCSGTYGTPLADYRGMLFFHDRGAVPTQDNDMHGGGGLLVAGNLYFHQNTSYGGNLELYGGTSSDTRILGNIVVDHLTTLGDSGINMQLNPNAVYSILTVQLLQ